jgi:hypothetical protein
MTVEERGDECPDVDPHKDIQDNRKKDLEF